MSNAVSYGSNRSKMIDNISVTVFDGLTALIVKNRNPSTTERVTLANVQELDDLIYLLQWARELFAKENP